MAATIPEPRRGLTFDDVWAALMENREQQKVTDQQMKETDRKMKETDRKFDRLEKFIDEIGERNKETRKMIEENGKQIGGLYRSFGELAEHLVAPNIAKRFNELGFHFDSISPGGQRIYNKDMTVRTEVDILLENSEYIIAVEVKTRPAEKDIAHHIKRLEIMRDYRDKRLDSRKILGGIAGAIFPSEVKRAVLEAGLYVLEQSGDTMKIEAPENTLRKEW